MPRNVYCDQCKKDIGDDKLTYFSEPEKDLDFCSEDCHSEWAKLMTSYKSIHPDFTPELRRKWEDKEFDYLQTKC